jgi:hypothetical protein
MLKIIRPKETSEINGNNLTNISRETGRHFRNNKREYLKDKIDELARNSKNKNIRYLYRGINDFCVAYLQLVNNTTLWNINDNV